MINYSFHIGDTIKSKIRMTNKLDYSNRGIIMKVSNSNGVQRISLLLASTKYKKYIHLYKPDAKTEVCKIILTEKTILK